MRQLLRDKVIIIVLLGIILYTLIGSWMEFGTRDLINLVYKSQYTHFISMLALLVIGVRLGGMERENGSIELFETIGNVKRSLILSKYIFSLMTALFLFVAYVLVVTVLWLISGSTLSLFGHIFTYSLLRVLIPYITCSIIAVAIGEQVKRRYAYLLVLLVWCIISPISTFATQYVYQAFNIDSDLLYYCFNVLNMGARLCMPSLRPLVCFKVL